MIRVSDTFEQLATEKRLRFKLFFPLRPVLLQTDPDLLHTLLANLVGNAIKYCDRGGILLSVRRRGNEALIQVWDTGIGIVPEHLSTIFEEYFQVENSVRDRSQGIGLGLAIVRRIARLLNSEVVCRSQSGRGSVFELRVPLAVSEIVLPYSADEPVTTGSGAVSRLAGRRVAIIDDDFMVAKAIELSLKPLGIQVLTYFSAEEALADPLCAAADFHVCDLRLPGINGIECVEALQERAKRTLFGVLLTGDTAPGRIEMMHTSGWPVLYKPVDLGLLLEVLAEQEMRVARRGANRLVANGSGD